MMNFIRFLVLLFLVTSATVGKVSASNPTADGIASAPDAWLFVREGRAWWYRSVVSPTPVELRQRNPVATEQPVVDRVRSLMTSRPARVFALMDGNAVVHMQFNAPASEDTTIFGFSIGKTVTAMAVGQAICAGKLRFETKASELVPQLSGKALGNATVRDLLRMASGTTDGNADSTVWTREQAQAWMRGELNLLEMITSDHVAAARRGLFRSFNPGEVFSYKSTDPILLSIMTANATKMPWAQWVQNSVLNPMGAARFGFYSQDRQQNGLADSGIRLHMEDWLRFALWVKRNSAETGCFGDFVRESFKTQIVNQGNVDSRRFGRMFGGYGFFTWTDNMNAPNTVWASGWGGQRIAWSTDPNNQRMVIVFSSVENWIPELVEVARQWIDLPR